MGTLHHENYVASFRDKTTRKKYDVQLEMFLNPDYNWNEKQQTRYHSSNDSFANMVNDFVDLGLILQLVSVWHGFDFV